MKQVNLLVLFIGFLLLKIELKALASEGGEKTESNLPLDRGPLSDKAFVLYRKIFELEGCPLVVLERYINGTKQVVVLLGETHSNTLGAVERAEELFPFFNLLGYENYSYRNEDQKAIISFQENKIESLLRCTSKKYPPRYQKEEKLYPSLINYLKKHGEKHGKPLVDLEQNSPPTGIIEKIVKTYETKTKVIQLAKASDFISSLVFAVESLYPVYSCSYLCGVFAWNVAANLYLSEKLDCVLPTKFKRSLDLGSVDSLVEERNLILAKGINEAFLVDKNSFHLLAIMGYSHVQGVLEELEKTYFFKVILHFKHS